MLAVKNLCCVRDERILFQKLNFWVNQGELVQIEGANGAGKTSLLRILAGLSQPDEGDVEWRGKDIRCYREHYHRDMLFLGHHSGIKLLLSPYENLFFYQVNQAVNADAIWQALAYVGLMGYENLPVIQLSAGQQRRVALARLWLSDVALWILDEPLTAIDKQVREDIISLFQRHLSLGGMVLLTTHQDLGGMIRKIRTLRLTTAQSV